MFHANRYQYNLAQVLKYIKYQKVSDKQTQKLFHFSPWQYKAKTRPMKASKAAHIDKLIKYMQRSQTGV